MGQNNCCQASDNIQDSKIKSFNNPLSLDNEGNKAKNLNQLLLFQIYNGLCNDLLKVLEKIKYKLVLYQLQNDQFSNPTPIIQNQSDKEVSKDEKQSNNASLNQANTTDYDSQYDSANQILLIKSAKNDKQQNVVNMNEMSDENINSFIISEMIKTLHNIVTTNNGSQLRGSLTNKYIHLSIKNMESTLFQFLQLNKYSTQKKTKKYLEESQQSNLPQYEGKQNQRCINKQFLVTFLNNEDLNQLNQLCQRIFDILPNEKSPQLLLKSQCSQQQEQIEYLTYGNNENSHATFNGGEQKKSSTTSTFARYSQSENRQTEIPVNYVQEFPFPPSEIIRINKKKKQILVVREERPSYIIFNRLKNEVKLQEKIQQLKFHHQLSHNHQNSVVLKISCPFNILRVPNQEYFLFFELESQFFTMKQFMEEFQERQIKFTEMEYLTIIKDVILILKDLEKYNVGHRNINPNTIVFSIQQKQWVINEFQKAQINIDIRKKSRVSQVFGQIIYLSPEIMEQSQDISKTDNSYQFSLKAQDVYAMGMTLAQLKCPSSQVFSKEYAQEKYQIDDNFIRDSSLCISDYIIAQMISYNEKERSQFDYQDILSLIDEEFNAIFLTGDGKYTTPQHYESIISNLEKQACSELQNQQEQFLSDKNYKLNSHIELLNFSKVFQDENIIKKLSYEALNLIQNEMELNHSLMKKEVDLFNVLIQIHQNKKEYKEAAHLTFKMIIHPLSSDFHHSIDPEQINSNIKLLFEFYDKIIQSRMKMVGDFIQEINQMEQYIFNFKHIIRDQEKLLARLEGYNCKAYYDFGDISRSKQIFEQIKDKVDKQFSNYLKGQFIENMVYEEFDPSQWELEKAIEILEHFKRVNRKDTDKFVQIVIRIAEMNLLIPNYEEALNIFEDANTLITEFNDEVITTDQLEILEKISDLCQILNKENKRKQYIKLALELAIQQRDNKAKLRLKDKYKSGQPNLLLAQLNMQK